MSEVFHITPYSNGYIERKQGGLYEGEITVDGKVADDDDGEGPEREDIRIDEDEEGEVHEHLVS